jgi:hypothetical protein
MNMFDRHLIAAAVVAVSVNGLAVIASPAVAGAKGKVGVYSAPSPNGRVVVGTVPGGHVTHRRGYGHYGNGVVVNTAPQRTGLGPRNYYFEQRTGQGVAGEPNMPSVYFNNRTGQRRVSGTPNRVHRTRRPHRPTGLTSDQVRRLTDSLPPRQRNNIIDPRSPAAQRESSGIRFGPSGKNLVRALSAKETNLGALSGRNIQGYRQGAPRHDPANLPVFDMGHHRGRQYLYAQGTWYLPVAGRLQPALPPVGLTVPQLPTGFSPVRRSGNQYFTADGVYLRAYGGGYVVVESPASESATPR